MRAMKDSGVEWIGEIPEGWSKYLLFQLVAQVKTKNENLQETNLLSLSYGKIKRKSIDTVEGLLPESFDGYNIIEKDDIVLRLTDLQNDRRSLRTGISQERGIITSAYVAIKASKKLNPKYFYYLLHSYDLSKVLYNMGSGVRQGLNYDELSKLKLIEPTLIEQEEIVAFLDAKCAEIESCIEVKRHQISKLESYRKSIIFEYVTGKKEVDTIE